MDSDLSFLKTNGFLILDKFIEQSTINKIKEGFEKHNQFLIDQKLTDE